jgi:hypothetical protein
MLMAKEVQWHHEVEVKLGSASHQGKVVRRQEIAEQVVTLMLHEVVRMATVQAVGTEAGALGTVARTEEGRIGEVEAWVANRSVQVLACSNLGAPGHRACSSTLAEIQEQRWVTPLKVKVETLSVEPPDSNPRVWYSGSRVLPPHVRILHKT